MKRENELALIIAFYISKYDRKALESLGYSTFNDAYRAIEKSIGVKATSIKNRRDEFDPIHNNERVGWYQRPMSPSRVKIVEQFSSMPEPTLRGVVLDIIHRKNNIAEILPDLLNKISDGPLEKKKKFILRGPTGKRAEELFISEFKMGQTDFKGDLIDCRDLGQGYDFRAEGKAGECIYIEVKGLDGYSGGVLFTDKEWRTACDQDKSYYLVIVSGIKEKPNFDFFRNPAKKFSPKRTISTNISVSWNISPKQLFVGTRENDRND